MVVPPADQDPGTTIDDRHHPGSAEPDLDRPNAARMYDYYLGGSHHFAADRQAAAAVLAVAPDIALAACANRAFLARVVRYATAAGIRQFLDLGSGIPTAGNVHQIADPGAHVVYVDVEPVAVTHARTLLGDHPTVGVVEADIRTPDRVLGDATTRRLFDLDRPVAVLCVSVLHFIPGDLDAVLAPYRAAVASGSLLAISHATPAAPSAQRRAVEHLYHRTPTPLHLRDPQQIRALFTGFDLVAPGSDQPTALVPVAQWRPDLATTTGSDLPDDSPFLAGFLAGVARKPATQPSR